MAQVTASLRLTFRAVPDAQLRNNLLRLQARMGAPARQAAVRAGSVVFVAGAQSRTPVVSGDLRDSERTMAEWDDGTAAHALNGSDLVYARRIEIGFSATDSLGRTYNQPPQSYLRATADQDQAQILAAMGASLDTSLRQAVV